MNLLFGRDHHAGSTFTHGGGQIRIYRRAVPLLHVSKWHPTWTLVFVSGGESYSCHLACKYTAAIWSWKWLFSVSENYSFHLCVCFCDVFYQRQPHKLWFVYFSPFSLSFSSLLIPISLTQPVSLLTRSPKSPVARFHLPLKNNIYLRTIYKKRTFL